MSISSLTHSQIGTVDLLMAEGWDVTNVYSDGVVNMSCRENEHEVMVFVDVDGLIAPPRTHETMIVQAQLHDLEKGAGRRLLGAKAR